MPQGLCWMWVPGLRVPFPCLMSDHALQKVLVSIAWLWSSQEAVSICCLGHLYFFSWLTSSMLIIVKYSWRYWGLGSTLKVFILYVPNILFKAVSTQEHLRGVFYNRRRKFNWNMILWAKRSIKIDTLVSVLKTTKYCGMGGLYEHFLRAQVR